METEQKRIQSFAFIISICVAFCFACISSANITYSQKTNDKETPLDNRINPNSAPLESLIRLPNIGISKAEAIISYRENYAEKNNDQSAFKTLNDLQNVKGIGPITAQNLSQWLKFE
jgi:competence ComEA-like helix-hairpin-helix protein